MERNVGTVNGIISAWKIVRLVSFRFEGNVENNSSIELISSTSYRSTASGKSTIVSRGAGLLRLQYRQDGQLLRPGRWKMDTWCF